MTGLQKLEQEIVHCADCPRLVRWREEVAQTKRRAYRDWTYWGRPVPGFGDPHARLVIVGLAPGAHGANRTGRVFTGDRSGEFLYSGLYRAGFANQPRSEDRGDGLALTNVYITAAVRCVPPDNKPSLAEIGRCASFLERELQLLEPKVLLALGAIAWGACLGYFVNQGMDLPRQRLKFGHGARLELRGLPTLFGCYHVSQQNTQTGRLTVEMFDSVLSQVKARL